MTKEREALKLALSTLNEVRGETFRLLRNGQKLYAQNKVWDTVFAIREVLEQPDQEPSELDVWKSRALQAEAVIEKFMAQPEQEPAALVEKFSLLLWDYQELERAFEKATGGKWIRKSNTPQPEPVIDKSAACV